MGTYQFEAVDPAQVALKPQLGRPQWESFRTAEGELLEACAVFIPNGKSLSFQVRSGEINVLAVMCEELAFIKFLSPKEAHIVASFSQ